MKKIILPTIGALLLITGCNSTNMNINKVEKEDYIKYNNTNHIVGEKHKAIEVLTYTRMFNDKVDEKITFYIDKFPFNEDFNLCEQKQFYKNLELTQKNKHILDELNLLKKKINCIGYIKIQKEFDKKNISGEYKFNILKGIETKDSHGNDSLFANISKTQGNSYFEDRNIKEEGLKGKEEVLWTRTKK